MKRRRSATGSAKGMMHRVVERRPLRMGAVSAAILAIGGLIAIVPASIGWVNEHVEDEPDPNELARTDTETLLAKLGG